MSYSLQSTTSLSSLGDAIRSKTGGSSQMTVEEMITAVNSIVTGGGGSSSGWIKRKKYKTTSALTITHGTYFDVDTELAQDKEFVFLLTTQDKTASVSQPAKNAILLFYDGSSLVSQYLCASSAFNLTFAVNYDSTNQVNKLRITNNETQYDLDLRSSGYSENGEKVWGNLFYLDDSINSVLPVNIRNLNGWCYNNSPRMNDDVIDKLWDKLTFNLDTVSIYTANQVSNAFSGYRGTHYDWTDKEIVLNGSDSYPYVLSLTQFCRCNSDNSACVIRIPPKFVSANNYPFTINQCGNMFNYSRLVEMRSDFLPSNFTFEGSGQKAQMFYQARCLRRVPDNFLAEMWANSISNIAYSNFNGFLSAWMYAGCIVLPKILGMPVTYGQSGNISYPTFANCVLDCYSLHRLTFYMPNGSPATANLINQTIDLSANVGYWPPSGGWNLDGIKQFLLEDADKNNAFLINSANDATGANVENINSYAVDVPYATYTRKSAVETINSLPDTSAALAAANANGGTYTNTIKFNYGAGSAYGSDYYMASLSAAEIAVATAKGWTVTLL